MLIREFERIELDRFIEDVEELAQSCDTSFPEGKAKKERLLDFTQCLRSQRNNITIRLPSYKKDVDYG